MTSKRKDGKIMEPSVVAVDLNNYEIVAVGEKAKNMEGKTPDNIITLAPIKGGKIINFEIAQVMLTNLLKKAKSAYGCVLFMLWFLAEYFPSNGSALEALVIIQALSATILMDTRW